MKGWKIDLSNYTVERRIATVDEADGDTRPVAVNVREMLTDILTSEQLRLKGSQIISRHELVREILETKKDHVILSSSDYNMLKKAALDTVQGFTKTHAELLLRIENAEQIDLKEEEKKGKKQQRAE